VAENPYLHAPRVPEGATFQTLLPGEGPLEIEVGPGRGIFIQERLAAAPDVRLLGLEIRLKWASIVDERLGKLGLGHRARVFAEDALFALPKLGPDACVSVMYVHFPDPWWKKRHTKRLVIGQALVEQAVRLLRPGGELFIQTDVEDRAVRYRSDVDVNPHLEPAGDEPGSPLLALNPYAARTNREHRADEDGLPVWRLRWRRRA
jgi:tRNA (guanine-N7-)-methyltransferase